MFSVRKYNGEMQKKWDSFISDESVNGTFLQSMNFLSYHPPGRFVDHSLIIEDNDNNIYCVIPGCETDDGGCRTFFSHKGSTYGGLVVNGRYYQAAYVQEMIELLEDYLRGQGFERAVLKITPDILSKQSPALLEYLLGYNGYDRCEELSTYVDLEAASDDVASGFNANKRKLIRRMTEQGYNFRQLHTDDEIIRFHELLTLNLAKYDVKPIHSVEDLLDFKNARLTDHVSFYGVEKDGIISAAGMMFEFNDIKVAHAQNLSTNPNEDFGKADPITFLYYGVISHYKKSGFKKLSWGISTEEHGKVLNWGLIRNKEAYGSTYSCNRTFSKTL